MEKITLAQILDVDECDRYGTIVDTNELFFYIKKPDTFTEEFWDDDIEDDIEVEMYRLGRIKQRIYGSDYYIETRNPVPVSCKEHINFITVPVEMRKNGRIKSVPVKKSLEIKSLSSTRARKKVSKRVRGVVKRKRNRTRR